MSRPPFSAPPAASRPDAGPGVRLIAGVAAASVVLIALAACSTAQIDSIPANIGGLPAGTPARQAVPEAYPPVHDMPPARPVQMLDEGQQERLEKDLIATRDRQSKQKKSIEREAGGTRKP